MRPIIGEDLLARHRDDERWIATLLQRVGVHLPGATLNALREDMTPLLDTGDTDRFLPPGLVHKAWRQPHQVQTEYHAGSAVFAVFHPSSRLTVVGHMPDRAGIGEHQQTLHALLTTVLELALDNADMAAANEDLNTWATQLQREADVLRWQYQDCIEQNFRDHERIRQKEQAYAQALQREVDKRTKELRQTNAQANLWCTNSTALSKLAASARSTPSFTDYPPCESQPRLSILVAEDDAINRGLAVRLLEKQGYAVTAVNTGKAVLNALNQQSYDLVLMDVQMPEMDGLEVTATIRAHERVTGNHLPILAITAHLTTEDRERCLAVGMDGLIAKPIQTQELLSAIIRVCPPSDAAMASPPNLGPVDLAIDQAAMLAAVGGDMELLRELTELFLADYPHRRAQLRQAIAEQDLTAVARAAHTLKGAVGTLGADDACDAAFSLEQAGWSGDLAQIPPAYAALEHAMQRLIPVLSSFIKEATS